MWFLVLALLLTLSVEQNLSVEASIAPVGSGYFVGANKSLLTTFPDMGPMKRRPKHRMPNALTLQRLLKTQPGSSVFALTLPLQQSDNGIKPMPLSLAEVAQPRHVPVRPLGLIMPAANPLNSAPADKSTENPAEAAKQTEVTPQHGMLHGTSPEYLPSAQQGPTDAPVVVLPPKTRFDYGTYHQWMSQLDELRRILAEELSLAKDLGNFSREVVLDAQTQLSAARATQTQLEQVLLNAVNDGSSTDIDTLKTQFQQNKSNLLQAVLKVMPSQAVETRAIWLDRGSIIDSGSPEGLRRLMGKLSKAGLNTIFFEALNAGYPLFNSPYLPKNPLLPKLPNGQTWDPLAVAVEEGHRLGMEVHAWVWCFAVGNTRHNQIIGLPDQYPGPIITNHPGDALRGVGGNLIPRQGKQTEFWLSPASPNARDFLKNVMTDLVKNYPVDGVQLDYIRYPFQTAYTSGGRGLMGFEPAGRQRFEMETGLSLNNLNDNTLRSFTAWKTNQISQFVKDISLTLKAERPGLKLSAAVYPMRRDERILAIQQDWETWLANGWLDILCPMTYSRSVDGYNQALRDIDAPLTALPGNLKQPSLPESLSNLAKLPTGQAFIYPGIALHRLDDATATGMVRSSHNLGLLGNTLFAMVYLDDQSQKAFQTGAYKLQPAQPAHHDSLNGLLQAVKIFHAQCTLLSRRAGISPTEAVSGWGPVLEALTGWEKRLDTLKTVASNNGTGLSAAVSASNSQLEQVQAALQFLIVPLGSTTPVNNIKPVEGSVAVISNPTLVLPILPHYITCFLKGNALRLDRMAVLATRGLSPALPPAPLNTASPLARQ